MSTYDLIAMGEHTSTYAVKAADLTAFRRTHVGRITRSCFIGSDSYAVTVKEA